MLNAVTVAVTVGNDVAPSEIVCDPDGPSVPTLGGGARRG
jgi:hypothetical protein